MRTKVLVLGFLACMASPAAAERVATVVPELVPATLAEQGETVLRVEIPDVSLGEGEVLESARLEFQVEMPAGSEVQLWAAPDSAAAPWAREDGSREDLVDLWVTDERTGTLVRLEVTRFVRLATEGTPAPDVLYLRMLGPDMEPVTVAAEGVTGEAVQIRLREDAVAQ